MAQDKDIRPFTTLLVAAGIASMLLAPAAFADPEFRHIIEGYELDLSKAEVGKDPEAVKKFQQTGKNPLNGNQQAIEKGQDRFLTACAGCHGHNAKGKLGPSLVDDYWTYPKNATDGGLFSTIFGGAQAQMGPHYPSMTKTAMLEVMAYVRSIYEGKPSEAEWLTAEQRKVYKKKWQQKQSEESEYGGG